VKDTGAAQSCDAAASISDSASSSLPASASFLARVSRSSEVRLGGARLPSAAPKISCASSLVGASTASHLKSSAAVTMSCNASATRARATRALASTARLSPSVGAF
jgi:hypothetical protein